VGAAATADHGTPRRAGYRRSAGTPRGEARRRDLLDRVVDDLAANGLVDFSLRRAARAAGTTHKVLLYYFDGADDLLEQAIFQLRERRIANSLAAGRQAHARTLAAWVRASWSALIGEESRVLDQAIGLMMYDSDRYAGLGQGASEQYLPTLLSVCPPDWSPQRKLEVSEMILAALRGFLIDRLTSGDTAGVQAGFEALARALDREEAADEAAGQGRLRLDRPANHVVHFGCQGERSGRLGGRDAGERVREKVRHLGESGGPVPRSRSTSRSGRWPDTGRAAGTAAPAERSRRRASQHPFPASLARCPRAADQPRAWKGWMSCSARSSSAGPDETSCSTGTGRPSRPVRPTVSSRAGNVAQRARTSQMASTTPRLTA
jgi:AcrR family transcriptional regulator